MFPRTSLPPTRYMLAAMAAPGPRLPLQVEGWLWSVSLSLSPELAVLALLPPLCVGKWWIDQYETAELRDLKETVHPLFLKILLKFRGGSDG